MSTPTETHAQRRARYIAQETESDLRACLTPTQKYIFDALSYYMRDSPLEESARVERFRAEFPDLQPLAYHTMRNVERLRAYHQTLVGHHYVHSASDLTVPLERWLCAHYEVDFEKTNKLRLVLDAKGLSGMRDVALTSRVVANLHGLDATEAFVAVPCYACKGGDSRVDEPCARCLGTDTLYYAYWKNNVYNVLEVSDLSGLDAYQGGAATWPYVAGSMLDLSDSPRVEYTYNYANALSRDIQYHAFGVGTSDDSSAEEDYLVAFIHVGNDARDGFTSPIVFKADNRDDQAIFTVADLMIYCTNSECDFSAESRNGGETWDSETLGGRIEVPDGYYGDTTYLHETPNPERGKFYYEATDGDYLLCPACHKARIAVDGLCIGVSLERQPTPAEEIAAKVDAVFFNVKGGSNGEPATLKEG